MAEKAVATSKASEAKQTCSNSCKQNVGLHSSGSTADMILQLQRTAGNQAVQKLIKSGALQAKLRISQPNDVYEQEADRTAEQVMRMPEPQVSNETKVPKITADNPIRRKCPECKLKKEEDGKIIQTKEISDSTPAVTPELESNISTIRGGGQPLPESVRAFYEPRFGADFGQVRIYTNARAEVAAKSINARAFTMGQDISFGTGQYAPNAVEGQKLLAHELTHIVQQNGSYLPTPGLTNNIRQGEVNRITTFPPLSKTSSDSGIVHRLAQAEQLTRGKEVYDLLEGWTSSTDSAEILIKFQGLSKTDINSIINITALHASLSVFDVYKWLHDDMVSSDWKALMKIFITVNSVDLNEVIAYVVVDDFLEGWTSEEDSKEILEYLSGVPGAQLDAVLSTMESKAGKKFTEMVAYLFGEMQETDAQALSLNFFGSGSLKAIDYAVFWHANKIKDLLEGYTGIRDSRSILQNFQRIGGKGEKADSASQLAVLTKLNELTLEKLGRTAEEALMKDMQQEDYEALQKMLPKNLGVYSIEKNFLAKAWDKIVNGYDYVEGFIEHLVCGIAGIVVGIFDAAKSIVVGIIDIGSAIKNIIGWLISKASGGRFGRESEENVNNFFTFLGKALGAPLEMIGNMWKATKGEASLIEGPFEECKLAIFWVRKVANFIVNILLLIFAGYGAVKAAIEALEAIKQISSLAELLSKLGKLPVALLRKIKSIPGSLAAGGSRIISAIRNVDSIAAGVRKTIGLIRLAARDQNFWLNLRKTSGEFIESKINVEKEYWRKKKEVWNNSVTAEEEKIAQSEQLVNAATTEAETNPAAAEQKALQAEKQALDAQNTTNTVEKEVKSGPTQEVDPAKQPLKVPLKFPKQVEYESTDLSQLVIKERLQLGPRQVGPPQAIRGQSRANYAVFEYKDNGTVKHIIRKSEIFKGHSERLIHQELQKLGIKPEQVIRIYSERAPCLIKGCSALIELNYTNAEVTFSFEFGADEASMAAGNEAHAKAVDALFTK